MWLQRVEVGQPQEHVRRLEARQGQAEVHPRAPDATGAWCTWGARDKCLTELPVQLWEKAGACQTLQGHIYIHYKAGQHSMERGTSGSAC